MAQTIHPPQEELEYQRQDHWPRFTSDKALPADITSKWLHDNVYDTTAECLRVCMDSPFGPDIVYEHCEVTDPITRLGLLVGGIEFGGSEEFKPLSFDTNGRLRVDAAVSVTVPGGIDVEIDATDGDTIGMFAFEDGDGGNTPIPVNVDADGKLRVVMSFPTGGLINIFSEGTFAGSVEQTVVSYTAPALKKFNAVRVCGSGDADAVFRLKKNGATIALKRNNWTDRNVVFDFQLGFDLVAADVLSMTILHAETGSCNFSGNIYGEEA